MALSLHATYTGISDVSAILVIDDEPRICAVLRDYFEQNHGMLVQFAHTGAEAMHMLTQQRYDLALIDIPLPGISSFDLVALAANEDTPVLLMTGDPVFYLTMQQAGFPYVGKPFTLEALRIAAGQVMSDHARQLSRLKSSLKRLQASRDALAKAIAASDRLLDTAHAWQQLARWNAAVARTKSAI